MILPSPLDTRLRQVEFKNAERRGIKALRLDQGCGRDSDLDELIGEKQAKSLAHRFAWRQAHKPEMKLGRFFCPRSKAPRRAFASDLNLGMSAAPRVRSLHGC